MYLRAAKTDAENAGESTDGMAKSISELRHELWSLTGKQVDIQLDENTFKSTYQILKELSGVWHELSDVSQANILELVGGKRNSNVVAALLENFSVAEEALGTSADSAGSALTENEKVLDSIQGKLNIMKATFETLSQNLISSDIIKFFIDLGTRLMELIDGAVRLVDALGGLKTILITVGSALLISKGGLIGLLSTFPVIKTFLTGLKGWLTNAATAWKAYAAGQATFSTAIQATIAPSKLALLAITGVTAALSLYSKKLEENRQKMIDEGKEAAKLTKDLDGLIEQYRKLGEDGKFDNSDREQAYDIQQQINELLGDEVGYINLANGKYEDQLELLKKLQYQKANDKYADFKEAKDSAEESLRSKISNVGVGNNIAKSEMEAIEELSKLPGMDKYLKTYEGDNKGRGKFAMFNVDTSSTEAMVTSYEKMVELRNILSKSYADEIKKGGSLEDFYNNLKEEIGELSDAVTKYKEAMSDYNINQAVITFNETEFDVEGLGKIKGAFINSEEAMSGWITSMINAEDVSDGVQAELIALAQTWYPQYTKQINEAVEAEAKKVAQDAIADKSLAGNIQGLKNEASALGIAEGKMIDFVLATIRANKQELDVKQKVAALKEVATWAGVAEKKMDAIFNSKDTEGWAERNGVTVNEHADIDGTHTYTYKGKDYRNKGGVQEVLLDEAIQKEIEKMGNVKVPSDDNVPGGGSKGSDKKNEALDNYLKDAENRYKIHQDETKYINELNYALQNLVKTKDEELDVTGKINEAYRDLAENRINDLEHQIDLKKELYGEDYDATSEWSEIQRIAHEEADRYREYARTQLGYYNEGTTDEQRAEIDAMIEKTDEIQDNQKTWWDAENNKPDFYSKQHENIIRDIEHARDMALEANPFTDTTSYYKQMQDAYRKEAERLRALDPEKYAEDIQALSMAWWDAQNAIADWSYNNSQNWITLRNTYNDWDKYGDNEAKAWKRVLDRFNKEFPTELDKIREIEENYYNAIKDEVNEILDLNKSRIESQKTLMQSYYDVTNSVTEAQHEINKELRASKTMYEYLDESTRKLLFNQEDYNILSDKLVDIQAEADKLQRKYNQDILSATADNLDEITSKYQMQYETLMKTYEIAKAELEVAKKRQQLDNVLNERNVRMFINGEWQWVANTQDVIDAQNELADAKFEAQQALVYKEQTESMNELTAATDKFTTIMNKIDSGAIDLRDGIGDITSSLKKVSTETVPALKDVIDSTKAALQSFSSSAYSSSSSDKIYSSSSGSYGSSYSSGRVLQVGSDGNAPKGATIGDIIQTAGGNYKIVAAGTNGAEYNHASGHYSIKVGTVSSGSSGKSSGGWYSANKNGINISTVYLKQKNANGTGYTQSGSMLVGEEEPEVYIDSNGRFIPINQPTIFTDVKAGGKVFNGMQMKRLETLWDLSNTKLSGKPSVSSTDNSIHIGGITISEQGNEDWINGLRRYVYTHKGSM